MLTRETKAAKPKKKPKLKWPEKPQYVKCEKPVGNFRMWKSGLYAVAAYNTNTFRRIPCEAIVFSKRLKVSGLGFTRSSFVISRHRTISAAKAACQRHFERSGKGNA